MIMPGSVSVSSPRVEPELLHYLDVSWQSIIAADVDGTAATPYKVDQSAPNLNRYSATRRVARAIFMGTAPTHQQQNTGLDDKQINLGRSEEHTSELQSLMRISYAVFCLKKKNRRKH